VLPRIMYAVALGTVMEPAGVTARITDTRSHVWTSAPLAFPIRPGRCKITG